MTSTSLRRPLRALGMGLLGLLAAASAVTAAETRGGGPFAPREFPSEDGSPVDAVIVTSEALAPAFQVLADWHLARGTRCVLRTLEWVAANYPPGRDQAENLRFFLQDAHAQWGLRTVILGGDTDVVPVRYAVSYFHGGAGEDVPTDLYYACLDGNWNGDGDSRWCESSYQGQPGDGADLYPELEVGRLPVSTPAEAAALVAKLIAYRETRRDDFQQRILFLAEVLTPSSWSPEDPFSDILLDGGSFDAALIADALNPYVEHHELFQSWENPLWGATAASPRRLNVAAALDSMDSGNWAFVDQNGHGFRYNMSLGDGSCAVGQALALTNSMPFHLMLMNCSSAAFDFDCLAENFLRNPVGGAVAALGASRDSYPLSSWRYPDYYYKQLFQEGLTRPGRIVLEMRQAFAPGTDAEGSSRWTYLIMNYLGDPLLDLWAGAARTLDITAPAAVETGWQQVDVTVRAGVQPVAGATVTLSKAGELWSSGETDAAGLVRLPIQPLSAGAMDLVVWAPNAFQETRAVTVNAPAGAAPHLADWQLDDDPALDALNDGDGLLEAGESARLVAQIANDGLTDAQAFTLRLESLDPLLTVETDAESFGALPAGGAVWGVGDLVLRAQVDCPDAHRLRLALHVEDLAQQPLHSDTLAVIARAPAPVLAQWTFTDVGNGDGIWDESESWRAAPRWVNLGGGSGGPLSAQLVSHDVDLTVLEGDATLGPLELLESGAPAPGFLVQRVNAGVASAALLSLTDAFGRVREDSLDFLAPSPPAGLGAGFSEGAGELALRWEPVADADLAGYLVYVSQSSPTAFTRVTPLPLPHAGISLVGLAENSETWAYVTAVDRGGFESAAADTLYTSTSPPQLAGFPQATGAASSCPLAVGNVSGDAGLELVVGANVLYVWTADGNEPLDGDGDAQTLGPYSTAVRDVVGAVTLLPVPGTTYRRIAVATRDYGGIAERRIFLMDDAGQVLPGWPRPTLDWIWANLVAADLDGDGDDELAALDRSGNLYAFHADGSELIDGDANPATTGIFRRGLGSYSDGSPAAADLDGDGDDELVVMGGLGHRSLHVFDGDGSELPGWPVNLDPLNQLPGLKESRPLLVANLDNDPGGALEIVLCSENDSLYVFTSDGNRWPGWPRRLASGGGDLMPGPAPADVDGDGDLELFVLEIFGGGASRMHLFQLDGSEMAGWPLDLPMHAECSPVVGDLDGDGLFEVIQGSEQGVIYGYRSDGTVQPGFPIAVGGEVRGTPCLADLDGDGDIELLVSTWNRRVLAWDFSGPFGPETCPWPTLSGSALRRGEAGRWDDVPVAVSAVDLALAADGAARVAWRVGDPSLTRWDLERRRRPAPGASWSGALRVAEDLRPDGEGWCRWRDASPQPGEELEYTALARRDGQRVLLGRLLVPATPLATRLVGAHPNPFNPSTTVEFTLGAPGRVALDLLDVEGRRVRRLVDGLLPAGRHAALWDGRDEAGRLQASGVYLAQLRHAGGAETCRLLLLK